MDLKDELLEVERQLWQNDPELYRDNLTPEAMLVFPETGVITRDFAVDAVRKEVEENRKWADVAFSEVHVQRVAPDVAALTYKARARWSHEKATLFSVASSIYVRRDHAWKLALHQQGQLPQT